MSASNARVLLVEDEQSAAAVLKAILELEGFNVAVAANGRRALDLLENPIPSLIITDYMMPVMDGVQMVTAIRAMPAYESIPIVMTSGVGKDELGPCAKLLSAFLRKPFAIEQLLDTISCLLPRSE
ncbi:MAG: response regulator [Pseudomonadota bacterium]|nr:response regulator [Pseudomonadota bacterium]